MASKASTVDFIVEQAASAGTVSARKMFGEYGVYCDGVMVALICDDQLFLKPTAAGRARLVDPQEAPPYKGAKPCLVIPGGRWDDGPWLAELFRVSAAELPRPAAKPGRTR